MSQRLKLFHLARGFASRCYSSPVIMSDKLTSTKFFTPILDVEKKLEDLATLQENIEFRKLDFDLPKLKSLWDLFKHMQATRMQLEQRKVQIADHMQDLRKIGSDMEAAEEMEKLKVEYRKVREDLKTLMTGIWEVEEKVEMQGLLLPNNLHRDTPKEEDTVMHSYAEVPEVASPASHLEIGQNLDLIDYRDPSCYFLKNEAALFEVSCAYYFAETLKKNDFISFCNPDCSRSGIVDGCGRSSNQLDSVFVLKEKLSRGDQAQQYKLHLVGGASLYPFCAFHAKQTVGFVSLPLKYFTVGRQYSPSPLDSKHGLYDTWQKTTNEIFILTVDDYHEMMTIFHHTLDIITSLYKKLNHHFRIVYIKASDLESWESLRASFQMYSCHERKYIEVGKLSISDSFIPERLLMTYQMSENDEKKRFMKMISGTAVNITKLLACVLEQRNNSNEKFSLPECLKSHWTV